MADYRRFKVFLRIGQCKNLENRRTGEVTIKVEERLVSGTDGINGPQRVRQLAADYQNEREGRRRNATMIAGGRHALKMQKI